MKYPGYSDRAHSTFIPTFGTSKSVTRKIEMPR